MIVLGENGVRLAARAFPAPHPKAPSLLLLHGLASSQHIWDLMLPGLTRRFRVVTYEGRERVDLIFADRAIERCGLPIARAESRVWLRVSGVTMLAPGLLARLPEPSEVVIAPFEIHYESPVGARYVEAHRAVARLEITAVTSESVDGRLSACFADVARSCVRGSFHATPCRSRIDGRALREPPGLADEALEPIAASSPEAEP